MPYAHVAGKAGGQAVAFIHQDLGLVEWMTMAKTIALALGYIEKVSRIDWPATEARAAALICAPPKQPCSRVLAL